MNRKKTADGFIAKVLKTTRKKVDAIKDEAYKLGWTKKELYSKRGKLVLGPEWGLIAVLDKHDKIIGVTEDHIVIQSITGGIMRFYKKN